MNSEEIKKTIEACEKLKIDLDYNMKFDLENSISHLSDEAIKEFKIKLKESWKEELKMIIDEFEKINQHLEESKKLSWKEQIHHMMNDINKYSPGNKE
jgi:hypothetical protein